MQIQSIFSFKGYMLFCTLFWIYPLVTMLMFPSEAYDTGEAFTVATSGIMFVSHSVFTILLFVFTEKSWGRMIIVTLGTIPAIISSFVFVAIFFMLLMGILVPG